tara:strand:- start:79550 stop:79714 length:165 start_codon:yes stop_codon:yes gene_type:complete
MNTLRAFGIVAKEFSQQIQEEHLNENPELFDKWEKSFSYTILLSGVVTLILLQL